MRQLLLIFALAFLFSSTVPAVFAEDKAPNREKAKPNVIVIMADDIGAEGLACYGSTIYTTLHQRKFVTKKQATRKRKRNKVASLL